NRRSRTRSSRRASVGATPCSSGIRRRTSRRWSASFRPDGCRTTDRSGWTEEWRSYRRLVPEGEGKQADRQQNDTTARPAHEEMAARRSGDAGPARPRAPLPVGQVSGAGQAPDREVEERLLVLPGQIADADQRGGAESQGRERDR